MRVSVGPCHDFGFHRRALKRLGVIKRLKKHEARCLAEACIEIRDRGATGLVGYPPGTTDIHRCGYIIVVDSPKSGVGTVLDFIEYSPGAASP